MELRRTLDSVTLATSGLTESLTRFQNLGGSSLAEPHYEPRTDFVLTEPGPNLLEETNAQLNELIARMDALVDVAKNQAELTKAISESTQATLQYSIQAGAEAKEATGVARASIELTRQSVHIAIGALIVAVISMILGVAMPIYLDGHSGTAQDLRDERALRTKELQVLHEISTRLAAQANAQRQPFPLQPQSPRNMK